MQSLGGTGKAPLSRSWGGGGDSSSQEDDTSVHVSESDGISHIKTRLEEN